MKIINAICNLQVTGVMTLELPRPILTVDIVLLTVLEGQIYVALQTRDKTPFAGCPALIGGYVHPEEDATTAIAAMRVLRDKAGVTVRLLEQLMTFSGQERDPRGWSASVAYFGLLPATDLPTEPMRGFEMLPLDKIKELPFDHSTILATARDRLRRRAAYSTLAAFMLTETFTLAELRNTYEIALGRSLNDSAFRRKVDELRIVEPVQGMASKVTARPAQLYRLRLASVTEFDRTL
jgi:8-oxo-dGTP diphosphatase